jgi:hypothetical protein
MKKNVGKIDKLIRFLIALVIVALYYFEVIGGTLGLVLLIFAGVLVITGLVNFCGIYRVFGINTCPVKK